MRRRRVAPLLSKSQGCVAAWATNRYGPSHSGLLVRDFVGEQYHAQYGSTSGSDSNDPTFAEPDRGKWWAFFPGVGGNFFSRSVPSGWANKSTGTFDIIARVYFDSVTPGAVQAVTGADSSRLGFAIDTSGKLRLTVIESGGSTRTMTSSVAVGFAAATWAWVKASYSWTTGKAQLFTSATDTDDPTAVVWVQLGTDVTQAVAQISASLATLVAGQISATTTSPMSGGIRYVAWYLDGVLSTGIDLTQPNNFNDTQTTVLGVTGTSWTITRVTSSGRPLVIVDSPLLIEGTDDYLLVTHDASLDPGAGDFTAFALTRQWTLANIGIQIGKKASSGTAAAGWMSGIASGGTNFIARISDGSTSATANGPTYVSGERTIVGIRKRGGVLDSFAVGSGSGLSYGSADASAVGSLANSQALTMGADPSAGTRYTGVHKGGGYFNRALSDAELRRLPYEMNAGFIGF